MNFKTSLVNGINRVSDKVGALVDVIVEERDAKALLRAKYIAQQPDIDRLRLRAAELEARKELHHAKVEVSKVILGNLYDVWTK